MTKEIFKTVLQLSINGTFVAMIAVILLYLLKYLPVTRKIGFILWIVIAVRLICPFYLPVNMLSSDISENTVDEELFTSRLEIKYDNYTMKELGEYIAAGGVEFSSVHIEATDPPVHENRIVRWFSGLKVIDAATFTWSFGCIFLVLFGVVSYMQFKRKLAFAMKSPDDMHYEADTINTPCVFGIFHPKVYMLTDMEVIDRKYALCHEYCHIQNLDHIWKILSYLIMCIHWFNPFLWIIYFDFQKYLEECCDEAVIRKLGFEHKEHYCEVILKMAVKNKRIIFSAMSLSEEHGHSEIKTRIKQILNYKNPKKSVQIVISVLFVALGIVFSFGENTSGDEKVMNQNQKDELTEYAELLYARKNKYLGDASANGALLNVLSEGFPDSSYTMRLITDEEPYGLRVVFKKGPQDFADADKQYIRLYKPAAVLLALIENAEQIMWEYPYDEEYTGHFAEVQKHWSIATYRKDADSRFVVQYHTREDIEEELAIEDIKKYGESVEGIQELLEIIQWDDDEEYFEYDASKSNPKIDYWTIDKDSYLESKERIDGDQTKESFELNAPDNYFFELHIKDKGFCEEYPIELRIYGFHNIWFMQEAELVVEWHNTDGYYFEDAELSVNSDDSLTYVGDLSIPSICFYNAEGNVITSVPWNYNLKFEFDYNSNSFRRINENYVRIIR